MSAYEEVDLLDMELDEGEEVYTYPCPCGDKFFITVEDLFDNEDKARCPSCSLILKVKFDPDELEARFPEKLEEDEQGSSQLGDEKQELTKQ